MGINDYGTIGGSAVGCIAGSFAGVHVGYKTADKLVDLVLKNKGSCIWDKFVDMETICLNNTGKAIAIGAGLLTLAGCLYLGRKIGNKIDEQS